MSKKPKGGENMNKNTIIIISIVLVIIALGGGFYGGMQYQSQKNISAFGENGNFRQRFGMMGQNGQNMIFRPVRGQVLNSDADSLTIKLTDGSTKVVVLSSTTTFLKSQKVSSSDLKTGDTVNVVGTQNSDGSVTAQDIQINPPTRPTSSTSNQQK